MADKTKEVNTLTGQVEVEMTQVGELGVQIETTNEVINDTTAALAEGEKFLEREKGCDTKTKVWGEVKKTSPEGPVALAETIKVLNDDVLEMLKKT